MRTSPARLFVVTAAVAALVAASPAPATAEVTPRPDSGVLAISGHGFGHGRGMSQWGAYGAAKVGGLSWSQILGFYYPGTTRSELSNSTIRVWISGDTDGSTTVLPAPGLTVLATPPPATPAVGAPGVALPVGSAYRAWRAVRGANSKGIALQFLSAAGAWTAYRPATPLPTTDLAFSATGTLRIVLPSGAQEEVRGVVHATATAGTVRTVLYTPMETYLRGVVPNEMPSSWHPQALAAQSVAARTYAAAYRLRQRARGSFYDICDSTTCQVFSGVASYSRSGGNRTAREQTSTNAAIAATSRVVLRVGGEGSALASTEFSASNGGWTTSGGVSYLPAKADPYDGAIANASNAWSGSVPASKIESAYGLGRLVRVSFVRDGQGDLGGRVRTVTFDGTSRSVTVSGGAAKTLLGLKSSWFGITNGSTLPRDLNGDGLADLLVRDAGGALKAVTASRPGVFNSPLAVGQGWSGLDTIVSSGQWDGAGGVDVLARAANGTMYLYPRSSAGAWLPRKVVGTGLSAFRSIVAVGDWNRDGHPDLMAVRTATGDLVLLPGSRGGTLGAPRVIGTRWSAVAQLMAPGDVTGDGRADIVATTTSGALNIYPGNGAGGFGAVRRAGSGWQAFRTVWSVGDVSGDAWGDLLALTATGVVRVYRGTGAGTFRSGGDLLTGFGSVLVAH